MSSSKSSHDALDAPPFDDLLNIPPSYRYVVIPGVGVVLVDNTNVPQHLPSFPGEAPNNNYNAPPMSPHVSDARRVGTADYQNYGTNAHGHGASWTTQGSGQPNVGNAPSFAAPNYSHLQSGYISSAPGGAIQASGLVGHSSQPNSSSRAREQNVDPNGMTASATDPSRTPPYRKTVATANVVKKSQERRKEGCNVFSCEEPGCKATFTTRQNLQHHIDAHYNRKPFSCDYCEKSFVTLHDCKRHGKTCATRNGESGTQFISYVPESSKAQ